MTESSYRPLILVGAARSGTKLVRDLVAEHPAVDKVPYDINFVWRLGNEEASDDELATISLTSGIRERIAEQFGSYHSHGTSLIEKTVSNCLRVPYVDAVFPNAKFIHLIRNGWDVAESAHRQWTTPPDWGYILRKARSFPLRDAPGYALTYVWNALRKFLSADRGEISTWGPRYKGIDGDVSRHGVLETCAIQWAHCAEKASRDLSALPDDRVITIRYEEFVHDPLSHLKAIAEFAGFSGVAYSDLDLSSVSQDNIGKGRRNLTAEQMERIWPHIERTMALLDYA